MNWLHQGQIYYETIELYMKLFSCTYRKNEMGVRQVINSNLGRAPEIRSNRLPEGTPKIPDSLCFPYVSKHSGSKWITSRRPAGKPNEPGFHPNRPKSTPNGVPAVHIFSVRWYFFCTYRKKVSYIHRNSLALFRTAQNCRMSFYIHYCI